MKLRLALVLMLVCSFVLTQAAWAADPIPFLITAVARVGVAPAHGVVVERLIAFHDSNGNQTGDMVALVSDARTRKLHGKSPM
jgi:hypothetical protein